MVWLRRFLGLLLAAAAAWLVTVLAAQVGALAAALVDSLLLALGLVLWAGPRLRGATALVAGVLALAAFALPAGWSPPRPAPETLAAERLVWQPLDATAIAGLVAGGQVVFVDVTAEWCITCQVNKKLVLDNEAVSARLDSPNVVRESWRERVGQD